ncbi:hypothetical protein ANN_07262 [Periplaneta americana]|uniref:Coenzyme Q-binding protein COQ10 START domain-containing protein n=1 Tax=Periplaneta americana TaxID=6978 RepID=A0ABQ8THP4_PERAM|nr:hypothetical protein ANN_07262 [Periplaneta americana]
MATLKGASGWRILNSYYNEARSFATIRFTKPEYESPVIQHCLITVPIRGFFNLPKITDKKKEYVGKKLVGYSMEQMYAVVSDVENYKQFVPFCKKSTVWARGPQHMKADLVIGFPPIHESYTSRITLRKPSLVRAVCTEGKLFNHLLTEWRFSPGLKGNVHSCIIDFSVSFEFRSLLHSQLAHVFFNEVVRQMEEAFLHEATSRFGKPSVRTQRLRVVSLGS